MISRGVGAVSSSHRNEPVWSGSVWVSHTQRSVRGVDHGGERGLETGFGAARAGVDEEGSGPWMRNA